MYDLFFRKFKEKVLLTPLEEEQITSYLTPKKLRKRQYLLQDGEVCRVIAFVEKGALREYSIENGGEHILQFALEGWTISDLFSFLTGEPATYNIDALEDSELTLIDKNAHDELLQKQPKYETYMRLLVTNAYLALQRRMASMKGISVEDQYLKFTETYPDIVQRVPQHMIASYLGLTPETVSRIRRRIINRKD